MTEHHKTRFARRRADRYFDWLKDLPPHERSLANLADQLNGIGDGVSVRTLERYSSDHDWQNRLQEHDAQELRSHRAAPAQTLHDLEQAAIQARAAEPPALSPAHPDDLTLDPIELARVEGRPTPEPTPPAPATAAPITPHSSHQPQVQPPALRSAIPAPQDAPRTPRGAHRKSRY
ncbi:hypothetical protein [Deinococcus pimensis]|uniref:hypothetical protein n=1 Tax=Deinococcus pimensis TaxID=309888 RepID=UPI000486DD5A|nr:hypothetical protein [Deinococcus pimensis]